MKRQELMVAAIENGTVIDHIPTNKLFQVVSLLRLEQQRTAVMVGRFSFIYWCNATTVGG